MSENKGILLYAEVTRDKYIHTVFFELANKALELSKKLDNCKISALLITEPGQLENYRDGFVNSGIDRVYIYEDEKFKNYNTEIYSKIAIDLVNEIKPKIAVPIHYGSIVGTNQDATDFIKLLHTDIKGKILML